MISFIRYDKGLGNNSIYSRIRNNINQYWDFETLAWENTELSGCKIFLTELPDIDSYDSLYLEELILPSGGPYIQEAMLNGINLAYDSTAVDTDTDALIQSIYDNMSKEATLLSLSGNVDTKFSSTLSDLSYIKNKVDVILNNVNGLSGDEATEIYLLNNILSDILILSGNIISVKSKTDTINWNDIIDLKDEALGKWFLNHNTNPKTLTLYRLDGVTILKTFTLGMTIDDIPPFISRE